MSSTVGPGRGFCGGGWHQTSTIHLRDSRYHTRPRSGVGDSDVRPGSRQCLTRDSTGDVLPLVLSRREDPQTPTSSFHTSKEVPFRTRTNHLPLLRPVRPGPSHCQGVRGVGSRGAPIRPRDGPLQGPAPLFGLRQGKWKWWVGLGRKVYAGSIWCKSPSVF